MGFLSDGKTLCWSKNKYSKEFAPFQLPCGKCISCRLEYARQTAVRCIHEAQMHEYNCFVTLTFNNENIGSNRLDYAHFQKFVKDLRNNIFQRLLDEMFPGLSQVSQRNLWRGLPKERRDGLYGKVKIGVFGVGEYGTENGRAHWHALIFNWRPKDATLKYISERGDRVYYSKSLEELWGRGIAEFGQVTFESAGYCARYSAKKLTFGHDGEHDKEPISRRSCRQAIGKSWIEKYWKDVFNHGYIVLPNGKKCGIPRYYEKWLKKHHPLAYDAYLLGIKSKMVLEAIERTEEVHKKELLENLDRSDKDGLSVLPVKTRLQAEAEIMKSRFSYLNNNLKI